MPHHTLKSPFSLTQIPFFANTWLLDKTYSFYLDLITRS